MIIELSVAVIAIALVIGIYFVIQLIRTINDAVVKMEGTMERLEKQVERVTFESASLLQKTNVLAEDIQQKSGKLDALFNSVQTVGDTVSDVTTTMEKEAMTHKNTLGNLMALTTFGIEAYNKWKESKAKEKAY